MGFFRKEIDYLMKTRFYQSFQITQFMFQVKFTMLALLTANMFEHKGFKLPEALSSYSLFTLVDFLNTLVVTFCIFIPIFFTNLFDSLVSSKRIGVSF